MLKAIIFDFDGVIVDSHQATIEFFQETFRYHNLPVPEAKAISSYFGLKTEQMLKNFLPELSDSEFALMYGSLAKFAYQYADKIELKPSVTSVLKKVKKQYKTALVTSRGKNTLQLLFKKHNLTAYFDVVYDREDLKNHKPHPEGINLALKKLGVKKNEVIYVGDTETDVQTAKNAGVVSVLISPKVGNYGENYHLQKISQLPKLVQSIEELNEK